MSSTTTNQVLHTLVYSFGGHHGPLANLHRKLDKEVWQAHLKATGDCSWNRAWEDIVSIFAEKLNEEAE